MEPCEIRASELIQFAHCATNALELPAISPDYTDPYSNYFIHWFGSIVLCVPDTLVVRQKVSLAGISNFVWFGRNTDSIEVASLHEVSRLLGQQ
jgi:hypothetical protein